MSTVAILPIKRFGAAKQRLTDALGPTDRAALAEAMARDVLLALARAEQVERTLVVSGEPRAVALARHLGAEVVDDAHDAGHSAAAGLGIAHARAVGAARVLLVPGDCPALAPEEVDGLLEAHRGDGVVVVPDRHGTGTNALLLSPPGAIAPAFGPDSCARHLALAEGAGVPAAVERVRSLAYDADTAADLAALRAQLEARSGGVTRAVLEALDRGEPAELAGG